MTYKYLRLLIILPLVLLISKGGANLAVICYHVRVPTVGYSEFDGTLEFILFITIWYFIIPRTLRWA